LAATGVALSELSPLFPPNFFPLFPPNSHSFFVGLAFANLKLNYGAN